MALRDEMQFGLFIPSHHPVGDHPTLTFERNLQTVEWLDELLFDEAWFGEHHSGGWELINSPELMIAQAAVRTQRIRLGTGVVSLPYHHPFIVADRMVQLDHLTRGRVMLGAGPGGMAADAFMLGINPRVQRRRMDEALEVILDLLAGEGPVNRETDWFTMREGRLQLLAFQRPRFPVAVVSTFSPGGMRTAGRHGLGVLSMGGFPGGKSIELHSHLADQWAIGEAAAAEHAQTLRRDEWRPVLPFYVAETREQAFADIAQKSREFLRDFIGGVLARPPEADELEIRSHVERGGALVGTPDDVIGMLHALQDRTGGFGTYLGFYHEWAATEKLRHSYELFARYVMPEFQGIQRARRTSEDWVKRNAARIFEDQPAAFAKAFEDAGKEAPPTTRF